LAKARKIATTKKGKKEKRKKGKKEKRKKKVVLESGGCWLLYLAIG